MQTVIPGGPPDLIAYAWFQIGFRPRSSVILVGIRGRKMRTGMVARVDLPPPRQRRASMQRLADMVASTGDDGVVALIVADPTSHGDLLSQRPLCRTIRDQVRQAGLALLDVLAVGEQTYRSYLCDDQGCCPDGGFPLTEVLSSATAAQMVLDGKVLAGAESDLVADVQPDPIPLAGLPRRRLRPATAVQRVEWMDLWRACLAAALDAPPPGPGAGAFCTAPLAPLPGAGLGADPGWLVPALEDVLFRDAVLITLADPDEPDPLHVPSQAWDEKMPNREVLRAGAGLLATVARAAPKGRRAEALAILGWMAWWSGDGARARLIIAQALADQPDHRLAGLIAQLLMGAVPPPWVDQLDLRAAAEWVEW